MHKRGIEKIRLRPKPVKAGNRKERGKLRREKKNGGTQKREGESMAPSLKFQNHLCLEYQTFSQETHNLW